jgi:hypothetical protein
MKKILIIAGVLIILLSLTANSVRAMHELPPPPPNSLIPYCGMDLSESSCVCSSWNWSSPVLRSADGMREIAYEAGYPHWGNNECLELV